MFYQNIRVISELIVMIRMRCRMRGGGPGYCSRLRHASATSEERSLNGRLHRNPVQFYPSLLTLLRGQTAPF